MDSLESILSFISIWSVLLPAITGLLLLKSISKPSQVIFGMVCLATIPQLVRFFVSSKTMINLTFNLYAIAEFFFIYLFFHLISNKNKILTFCLRLLATLFIISYLIILNFKGILNQFFNEIVCLNNLSITLCILLVILDKIGNDIEITLSNAQRFFLAGMMAYAPITIFIFSLWNYLKSHPGSSLQNLWLIHHFCNSFMYFAFTIGLIKDWQNKKVISRIY